MDPIQNQIFAYWATCFGISLTLELMAQAKRFSSYWAAHESSTTIHRAPGDDPTSPIYRCVAQARTFIFKMVDGCVVPVIAGLMQFHDITELNHDLLREIKTFDLRDPRVKGLRIKEDGEFLVVCFTTKNWSSKRGFMNPGFAKAAEMCFTLIETQNLDKDAWHMFEFVKPGGAVAYSEPCVRHLGWTDPRTLQRTFMSENYLSDFKVETIGDLIVAIEGLEGIEGYVLELDLEGVQVLLKIKTLWWRRKHSDDAADPIWSAIKELIEGGRLSLDNVLWAANNPEKMSLLEGKILEFLAIRWEKVLCHLAELKNVEGKERAIIIAKAKSDVAPFADSLSHLESHSAEPLELFKQRIRYLLNDCTCKTCKAGNKQRCCPTKVQNILKQIWEFAVPDPVERRDFVCRYTKSAYIGMRKAN